MDTSKISEVLGQWHEAAKGDYYRRFPGSSLSYDDMYPKTAKEKTKYICLDDGTSGAFLLEKATGNIYRIKGYGVIHRGKLCGNLDSILGQRLFELRRW